jgi:hypothetical protein|tara:strand:+ start:409 stop:582 length:174 start_codon:yes stop_codon:yes gene_type:complete
MFSSIVDTIKEKLGELSSWSGGMFIGTGVLILIGSPFLGMIAYGAIIYGAYLIIKSG